MPTKKLERYLVRDAGWVVRREDFIDDREASDTVKTDPNIKAVFSNRELAETVQWLLTQEKCVKLAPVYLADWIIHNYGHYREDDQPDWDN